MIHIVFLLTLNTENQRDFVFDPNTQLAFTAGSLSACIDVEIIDDNDVEGDQDFEILITDVTLGTVLISSSVTTVTITDNLGNPQRGFWCTPDAHCVAIDGALSLPPPLEALENDGNGGLQICTSLSSGGVLETDFIVTLMTVDGSAGETFFVCACYTRMFTHMESLLAYVALLLGEYLEIALLYMNALHGFCECHNIYECY